MLKNSLGDSASNLGLISSSFPPGEVYKLRFRIYHNKYYLDIGARFEGDLIYGMLQTKEVATDKVINLCDAGNTYHGWIDLKDPTMDIDAIIGCILPTVEIFKTNADQHEKFLKERLPFMKDTI